MDYITFFQWGTGYFYIFLMDFFWIDMDQLTETLRFKMLLLVLLLPSISAIVCRGALRLQCPANGILSRVVRSNIGIVF